VLVIAVIVAQRPTGGEDGGVLALLAILFVAAVVIGVRLLSSDRSLSSIPQSWWPTNNARLRAEEAARIRAANRARRDLLETFGPDAPPPDPSTQRPLGIRIERGVVVDVTPRSAAARVGLQIGDELLSVGREPVHGQDELDAVRARYRPGVPITLVWWREGAEHTAEVVV
jgi:S1-C subfamily serine protease